jgi:histidine triad (HIT) family protein
MSTIFTKIINREIPAQFVYEDEQCVVVMDKFPALAGQTLVIPKAEIDYAFALPDELYTHLFMVAKKIALASDQAFGAERTCLVVEGFEVPHMHIKLYPVTEVGEATSLYSLTHERKEAADDLLEEQAAKIRAELES